MQNKTQKGYSLIEVLIAIALMGTILLSIMSLFVYGRRNIYSGKQMTHAVAMGTTVLEDLNKLDRDQLRSAFVLGSGAGSDQPMLGVTYTNSFKRVTTNVTSSTDDPALGFLARWRDMIADNRTMQDGVVTLIATPIADPDHNPDQIQDATLVRLRVFVTWKERLRDRNVVLETVIVGR